MTFVAVAAEIVRQCTLGQMPLSATAERVLVIAIAEDLVRGTAAITYIDQEPHALEVPGL